MASWLARLRIVTELVAVAAVYVVTARIGQLFAINPGNISPVWIPSGIMLAWVLLRGLRLWPGVFLGAFAGNAWAYLDFDSWSAFLSAMAAGAFNGTGDVLCTVGAAMLIRRTSEDSQLLDTLKGFSALLLFGAVLGPLVSAVFGVLSLWAFGFMDGDRVLIALVTWWLGDGTGVLLLTPLILAFARDERSGLSSRRGEVVAYLLLAGALPLLRILLVDLPIEVPIERSIVADNLVYLVVPLLFWGVLRMGQRLTFFTILYFVAASLFAIRTGIGLPDDVSQFAAVFSLQLFVFATVGAIFVMSSLLREKDRSLVRLRDDYNHDPLTGLYNRQYFDACLEREAARQQRSGQPLSLLMFDIDHFKRINDIHGHRQGDRVLIALSERVQSQVRSGDVLARWGGEEFMVLMPGNDLHSAATLAERIRAEVEDSALLEGEPVTISLGVVEVRPGEPRLDVLDRLDAALYAAKRGGRNRVRVEGSDCPDRDRTGAD